MTNEIKCRKLSIDYVDPVANVISQAYFQDPLCVFVLPREKTRLQTLYKLFHTLGEVSIQNDQAYGIGDPLQGVAFWKYPEQVNTSISIKSITKFLPLLFTYYPIGNYRAREIIKQTDRMHEKYAAEPHFYLDNLAVLPTAQGQGFASKLIRPFLEMADAQKVIVYTDTVTHSNVGLYERFGFECVEENIITDTGVTVWALRRPNP